MKLNTANGQVDSADLGKTLLHEHLVAGFAGWEGDTTAPPMARADLVALCVDQIQELQDAGYSSLLDPCPNDMGRDVELYAEVAARTGFKILFATGLYHEAFAGAYWKAKIGADRGAVEALAAMYVAELTEGVGPARLKPAVIKLAVGTNPDSAYEDKLIAAAALASNATGAPILAHTEAVAGDRLVARLGARGVPAHRVVVGHSDTSSDPAYHRAIVETGAYIGIDRFGFDSEQTDANRTDIVHRLIGEGYAQHLHVSHDCVFCMHGRMLPPHIEARLALKTPLHLSRVIMPALRSRGVSQETLDSLIVDNPRRWFEGEPPRRELAS